MSENQLLTVDVRFYVQAANVQEAVDSVMQYLPALYPEPAVQTDVVEYDLHSVSEREVTVTGFNPPYLIKEVPAEGKARCHD